MYKIGDYISRGSLLIRNRISPRNRKLAQLLLYATDLCNSKCKHCHIWENKPGMHLPFEKIIELMQSKSITSKTQVALEGGEFLLHPKAMEILEWFHKNHPQFDLFSNCLLPDRTIEAVEKYPPQRLMLSLDGTKETYQEMRGKDGYDKVIQVIKRLKNKVPISVMYCMSPWNAMSDLQHVGETCKKLGVDLRVGIYSDIKFFKTEMSAHQLEEADKLPEIIHEFKENYDYLVMYKQWKKGTLNLSCNSILDSVVVLPNGDVPICLNLDKQLGNIHKQSLDEIMAAESTVETLDHHRKNCNACWINFHRKYDLILYRNFEKYFPERVVSKLFGFYSWG